MTENRFYEICVHPSDFERQLELFRFVEQHQRVSVPEICDRFSVSLATARQDLETLADQGKVQRVHGGVVAARIAPPEAPVLLGTTEQAEEKKRIGQQTAKRIQA